MGELQSMQQIFNKVYTHLMAQKERCSDDAGSCQYKYEIGGKVYRCAVGALIPDALYNRDIEGQGVNEDNETLIDILREVNVIGPGSIGSQDNRKRVHFLMDLQHLHDNDFSGGWPADFRRLAQKYDLKVPA